MKKQVISILTVFVLMVGILSVPALAADDNWAGEAVQTLNGIYGNGVFSADDTATMTEKDAVDLLKQMGCTTEVILDDGTSGAQLTRKTACDVLADVFQLSLGSQSAIEYLYEKNILNGTANGLDENGKVSEAEFAVLTYRVLNAVGGGVGSDTGLTPGTEEHFAWSYLAARNCVPFEVYPNAAETEIKDTTMYTMVLDTNYDWKREEKTGRELWDAWVVELMWLKADGVFNPNYPGDSTNLLDVVVQMVDDYIAAGGCKTIFADVSPGSEFYDGVMYLFNHGINTGQGDGTFSAQKEMTRNDFAVLLYRNAGKPDAVGNSEIEKAQAYVTAPEQCYMVPVADDPAWWSAAITREEAIMAIMKDCVGDGDLSKANTAVLDRFRDAGQVSEAAKPYIAYAVSIGLFNGTTGDAIYPSGTMKSNTAGVLLYRTLLGLDESKMKDYTDNVAQALNNENETDVVLPMPENRTDTATEDTVSKSLTLREDWRLTDDLDLQVPEGTTLVIDGNGHHIYEMGGTLQNSGKGTVDFADGTILYPMNGATDGVALNGIWDTEESNALMDARKIIEYTITVSPVTGGMISADKQKAQPGETVKLSITPDDGYELKAVLVNDGLVALDNNQFIMPDCNVIVTATFAEIPSIDDNDNDSEDEGSTEDGESPDDGTGGSTGDGESPDDGTDGSTGDSQLPDDDNDGSSGGGSASNIITKTTVNADGSITITVTYLSTGTVTETTKNLDGSTKVVETKKNGAVTTNITDANGNKTTIVQTSDGVRTTVSNKDGSSSVTTVGEKGQSQSVVKLPASVVDAAAKRGEAVPLPMPEVTVNADREIAPTVTIDLPDGSAKVEIPARNVTSGTIVIRVKSDGTEEIIKAAIPADNGVIVTLSDGDIVKIMDNSKTFADVPDTYWGAEAVAFTTSRELFDGISSTTFEPETSMTRAMILTVLARLEGVDTSVGENWYDAGCNWAMENDISDGMNLGQSITREQLATMLWRYAGEPMVEANLSIYTDASSVSAYAQQAMAWAMHDGIITGYTATTLHPQEEATRAQVATILMRFVENIAAA